METPNETQKLEGAQTKLSEHVGEKVLVTAIRLLPAETSKYGKAYAIVQLEKDGKLMTAATSNINGLENAVVPFEAEVVTGTTDKGTYYALRRDNGKSLDGDFVKLDEILGVEGTVDDFVIAKGEFGEYAIVQFSTPDMTVKFATGSQPIMKDLDKIKGQKGVFEKAKSKNSKREYYCFRPN